MLRVLCAQRQTPETKENCNRCDELQTESAARQAVDDSLSELDIP